MATEMNDEAGTASGFFEGKLTIVLNENSNIRDGSRLVMGLSERFEEVE